MYMCVGNKPTNITIAVTNELPERTFSVCQSVLAALKVCATQCCVVSTILMPNLCLASAGDRPSKSVTGVSAAVFKRPTAPKFS